MDGDGDGSSERVVAVAPRRKVADEWALVLAAEGLDPVVRRAENGFVVCVAPHRAERAFDVLTAWREENRPGAPPPAAAALPPARSPVHAALAFGVVVLLLAFHIELERSGELAATADRASAAAARLRAGELWRAATALCLHSGLAHVVSNVIGGGFFLAVLSRRVGVGVAVALTFASGVLGNIINAFANDLTHDSIGASTAVFGAVGLLAGLEAWRRHLLLSARRGGWVALAAGVGLLAMLGTAGARVDYGAHIFGLLAGMALGLLLAPRVAPGRPGLVAQVASVSLAAGVLAWSWRQALA